MHVQSKESSVSWTSRVKPKLTVYDKLSKYFAFLLTKYTNKMYMQSVAERLAILNPKRYQNCWTNNKIEPIKKTVFLTQCT